MKILKASAGSGKTYRLAYEYIRSVIDSPQLYRHILAVTFTNKATEEMKQRIVGELNALANGSPSGYMGDLERDLGLDGQTIRRRAADARTKILHDYSRFTVLTIDKFFQRIIRSFIKELGIDLNFNLELQTDSILDSATDRLIDRIAVDRALRDWVLHFVEEKIDTDGRWDIRGEIAQLGRELFGERYRAVSGDKASREELSRIVSAAVARSRRIETEMKKTAAEALAVIDSAGLAAEDFAYGRGGMRRLFRQDGRRNGCPLRQASARRPRIGGKIEFLGPKLPGRSGTERRADPQTTAGQALLDLRRQHPLPEYGPAALGQLPQLRAARRVPVGESSRNLHGAEPGTDFGKPTRSSAS